MTNLFGLPQLAKSVLRQAGKGLMPLFLSAPPLQAQYQQWIEQFGTDADDLGQKAVPDGVGGVFVAGSTQGALAASTSGQYDAWLSRHDASGGRLWVRQLGTSHLDVFSDAAPDGSGGIFLTGYTFGSLGGPSGGSGDVWLARYDSSGTLVWVRQFGTGNHESPRGAASDEAGGVYLVQAWDVPGGQSSWLTRHDGSGSQLWIVQLPSTGLVGTSVREAAPDGAGGVYVTGDTYGVLAAQNSGQSDIWIARYDAVGNQLWIRQFGSTGTDTPYVVESDGTGGAYLGGDTTGDLDGPNAGSVDAWFGRCDGSGNLLWLRQLGTSGEDFTFGAAEDGAGGAFFGGSTMGSLVGPHAGGNDAWLARCDGSGALTWSMQFASAANEHGGEVAFAGNEGVFWGGGTDGSLGAPNAGNGDVWISRYGPCGTTFSHCAPSTTSIPGCQAAIGATGSPSLANPTGFTISSGSVPGGKIGICFFGKNGSASIPFGTQGGSICVQPPFVRSAAKLGGGTHGVCDGNYNFTLHDLINVSSIIVPGTTINAEIWARDPASADGFLLSNGLGFTVCP
jgi:hypothetical protein